MQKRAPQFIVYCGSMYSAKTSHLLTDLDRFTYQKLRIKVFKPRIDNRYAEEEISSHNGIKFPAVAVSSGQEILWHVWAEELPDVVAVDEAFMIDGCAEALITLYRSGVSIVVSSIEMSASCRPFEEIQKMFPWATKVEKLTAVCSVCQADAPYTQLKVLNPTDDVLVGGTELYEARCYHCHTSVKQ